MCNVISFLRIKAIIPIGKKTAAPAATESEKDK